ETLPQVANKLILEFRNWVNLQNPIIVDKNHIILDGNHRAFAFKKLKFKYISVCKVDYFSEATELRYWFRLLTNIRNLDQLRQAVEDMNGTLCQVNNKETLRKTLENSTLSCGIQQSNFYALINFPENMVNDAVSAYSLLAKIQNRLIEKGIKLQYIPCQSAYENKFCEELKNNEILIWTPRITKEMVVDAAKKEIKFAPKTTRHLIPARPLNVNVPTHWFKEDVSLKEINKRFFKLLERKSVRRFGPGQVIDGRYYEEELFVFID
ncbi:MAG: hypothetical protein JSV50_22555, partial [Desulfobacteraceae bacterium]